MSSQLTYKQKQQLLRKWSFYKVSRAGIRCRSCLKANWKGEGKTVKNPATAFCVMAQHAKKAHGFTDIKGEATIVAQELQKKVDKLRETTEVCTVIKEGMEGWKCGDCQAVIAYACNVKRHCAMFPQCEEANKSKVALYRTETGIMTDDELCEDLGKVNHDKVYKAVQHRRDDYAWVRRIPGICNRCCCRRISRT
jgi:hypothetical protein